MVSVKVPVPEPLTGLAVTKWLERFVSMRHAGSRQFAGVTEIENPNVPPAIGASNSSGDTGEHARRQRLLLTRWRRPWAIVAAIVAVTSSAGNRHPAANGRHTTDDADDRSRRETSARRGSRGGRGCRRADRGRNRRRRHNGLRDRRGGGAHAVERGVDRNLQAAR